MSTQDYILLKLKIPYVLKKYMLNPYLQYCADCSIDACLVCLRTSAIFGLSGDKLHLLTDDDIAGTHREKKKIEEEGRKKKKEEEERRRRKKEEGRKKKKEERRT